MPRHCLRRRVGLIAFAGLLHACGGTALVGGERPLDSATPLVDVTVDRFSNTDTSAPGEVGADIVDVPSVFDDGAMDGGDSGGPSRVDVVTSEGVVLESGVFDGTVPLDVALDLGAEAALDVPVDVGFDAGGETGVDVPSDVPSDDTVDVVTGDGGAPVRCNGAPFPAEPRAIPVPCRVTDGLCRPTRCSQIAGLTGAGPQTLYAGDGAAPYRAWCVPESLNDSTNGGAWTLVAKVDGNDERWAYDSPRWTDTVSDVEQTPSVDPNLALQSQRLTAYGRVAFHEVALAFAAPFPTRPSQSVRVEVAPSTEDQWRSMLAVLGQCERAWTPTPAPASAWTNALPGTSLQPHCLRQGLNVSGDDPSYGRARIGILGDDASTNACGTPDSRLGVGLQRTTVGPCASQNDNRITAGVVTWCNPIGRGSVMPTFTFVLVR